MLPIDEIRRRFERILPDLGHQVLPSALSEPDPDAADARHPLLRRLRGVPNQEVCRRSEDLGICPYFIPAEGLDGPTVTIEGRETIMLAGNNYLGLTRHPEVMQAARDALDRFGTSCTGSRFFNGTIPLHTAFEEEIADFLGYPKALLYSTGFMANQGSLSTLLRPGDQVFSDRDNHASLTDGMAASGATLIRYRHNDVADLDRRMATAAASADPKAARLVMGTLSKSLASVGGFLAGPAEVIEYLRFVARSFVFTASPAPMVVAAGLAALRVLRKEPQRVAAARDNARRLADGLRAMGYRCSSGGTPVLAVHAADPVQGCTLHIALVQAGVLTNMALYPAVPRGQALLRTSVMATHTRAHLDRALEIFERVGREVGLIGPHAPGRHPEPLLPGFAPHPHSRSHPMSAAGS
jgi:8-amino-7-oxononanoate synthase